MKRRFGSVIAAVMMIAAIGSVHAGAYYLTIETTPQVVDLFGSSKVKVKLIKEKTPVQATQIFLGLQGIAGTLKSEMVVSDKNGEAETTFYPKETGTGFVIARATINDAGKIETVEALASLTVRDLNFPPEPVVDQIYPLPGRVGQPMTFKGHGTDADGRVTKCTWTMGDGGVHEVNSDRCEIVHTYANPGVYDVSFSVTDDRNNTSQPIVSKVTVIDNKLPIAVFDGKWPEKTYIGIETIFPVLATDAESQLESLTIDFGDLTNEKISISGGQFKYTFKHTYTRPGIFNVTVTPKDIFGEGESYPKPSWPVKVDGEAKGGLTLKVSDAVGKTVRLVGPIPSLKVAFEATLGEEPVSTGQTLSIGQYRLLASDASFGFTKVDEPIEIKPFSNETIETSVWIPSVSVEPVIKSGKSMIRVRLKDQNGADIQKKVNLSVIVDNGVVEEQSEFDGGQGFIWIKPNEVIVNVGITARIGFVRCVTSKLLMFPKPLASIRLAPQSVDGQTSVVLTSSGMISGVLELNWSLFDKIERKNVPANLLFFDLPKKVYIGSAPFKIPIKPIQTNPGKYTLSVYCEIQMSGINVSDSCSFDPCAGRNTLEAGWGMLPNGSTAVDVTFKDVQNNPISGQRIKISYEFGRAIGWIPETVNFNGFPKTITTDATGYSWTSFELMKLLEGIEVEDVKITFSTVCSGLTYFKTISIPPLKSPPSITVNVDDHGDFLTVSLKAFNTKGEIEAGCWLDVRLSCCDPSYLSQLGYPPSSIRTSHNGTAHFNIKRTSKPITMTIRAIIDNLPAMCVVEIPKR